MDVPIENQQKPPTKLLFAGTNIPDEVFTDPFFLKDISFLEDVEKSFTSLSIVSGTTENINYGDRTNEYKLNSLGYRSSEFKKVPVVFAGCSITFGVGVPENGIWSTIVGEKLGLDYVNLGVPGWSIQAIVDNLFKYFYTYGNPETVFVAFPDYNRLLLTSNRDFCRVSGHNNNPPLVQMQHSMLSNTLVNDRPKYSKKPYEFTDFITPEYALLQTFRSINALVSYCKGANIRLVWSSWDYGTNNIIEIVKERFNKASYNDYVNTQFAFSVDCNKDQKSLIDSYSGCHNEYVSKYKENFFCGQDRAQNKSDSNYYSHPGVHFHIHIAEAMLSKFKELT
jgi:hypothetical protein